MNDADNREHERVPDRALERERTELLRHLADWLETPMTLLAFVWIALLVGELTWGQSAAFDILGSIIWGIFIVDFAIRLVLAPDRPAYIRANWIAAISLALPALRAFRIFRAFKLLRIARVGRGIRLVRILSSLNRGMAALGASLQRRGFGYVMALTVLVALAGSAGMYAFEKNTPQGLETYGEALWWTAMILTTMGSQFWPQTLEGRLLCMFLALYAFAVFGYVTAALATFFVGRETRDGSDDALQTLRDEVAELRRDIRTLARREPGS